MKRGYGQFCPIAKASEIFATRWTPLVLRELMYGAHTFNHLLHGVPLMSRPLLSERLRQLEADGIIEKRLHRDGPGHEYWLTPAGEAFRDVIRDLAIWGRSYARDRITASDLNPGLLMWNMRRRADIRLLPEHRIVIRFEFSGVPQSRTKLRIMWLILDRSGVDVCVKDPGFPVDLNVRGSIKALVAIYLGHMKWQDAVGKELTVDGDSRMARQLPGWLRLDKVIGHDYLPLARTNRRDRAGRQPRSE
jgi:DNA-binding HxlR family transcriptional regulator